MKSKKRIKNRYLFSITGEGKMGRWETKPTPSISYYQDKTLTKDIVAINIYTGKKGEEIFLKRLKVITP